MRRGLSACAAALALSACDGGGLRTSPLPVQRPEAVVPPKPAPPRAAPSESAVLSAYYRRIEARRLSQGRLRRDAGGADAPFDVDDVVRTFESIAFFREFARVDGRTVAQETSTRLRRWTVPVRVQLHFGTALDPETRASDARRLAAYLGRLRRATGHPISLVRDGGNFHVFVASVDEQRALAPALRAAIPALSRATIAELTGLGRDTYCVAYLLSEAGHSETDVAVAFIRAEHPDLMRQACYHEEVAQGLGLTNDSDAARPSIFNDDDEFALLTALDEVLLRILYDPRLRPGMTAEEARPFVRQIATEALEPGPS